MQDGPSVAASRIQMNQDTMPAIQMTEDRYVGPRNEAITTEVHDVITFTVNIDEELYVAVDDDKDEHSTLDVVAGGGQAADYPARNCLQLRGALEAARAFVETASRSPDIAWARHD